MKIIIQSQTEKKEGSVLPRPTPVYLHYTHNVNVSKYALTCIFPTTYRLAFPMAQHEG